MKVQQLGFDLAGGDADHGDPPLRESIGADDPLPLGPYGVGMVWNWFDGHAHPSTPYTITCGDGRAIAGHVESRVIAEAIAAAMNQAHPS